MATRKTHAANGKSVQEQLDEALADSFPASDPVSLVTSQTEEDWEETEEDAPPSGGCDSAKEPSAPKSNPPG
jgi:hypothetical protein